MKKEDFLPYLSEFVTVTLKDGSERSGFASNKGNFKSENDEDKIEIHILNGLFTDIVMLSDIVDVQLQVRDNTITLPVINLSSGYETPENKAMTEKPKNDPMHRK